MHYVALVIVEPTEDVESEVARLLAPFDENANEDGAGKWDWFQIGGRWTGVLDREYEPGKDARNHETCYLCAGTGVRPDGEERFGAEWVKKVGCNGCKGTGVAEKYPTQWAKFPGDIKPVAEIDVEWTPFTLVTPDGTWYERESFVWDPVKETGEMVTNFTEFEWRRFVPKTLVEHRDKIAVVVDYHS